MHPFYNIDHSFRAGCMANMLMQAVDSRSSISPRGLSGKLQYTAKRLFSLSEENNLNYAYYYYAFHEALGHVKTGIAAPWYSKHDIHLEVFGDAIKPIKMDTLFPSFNLPVVWLPGYTYYFRTTKLKDNEKEMVFDTVLITGNAVMSGSLSYRFPLSPSLIDKRIWVIYLEKLYGCLNVSGGAGFDYPSQLLDFKRKDWLVSYGMELRLQASTFNGMPLAVKFRWDRGIDRPAPIGGNRFTFGLGFDFDDWGLIMLPDYREPRF
jgi:hypothetical protein